MGCDIDNGDGTVEVHQQDIKEKNEAVTNLGDSHQDGHKGGGKTKKKTEVGRELQVRTTLWARDQAREAAGARQGDKCDDDQDTINPR